MDNNVLIGRNTVREAIKNGRSIDAVYVNKDTIDGSIKDILKLARERALVVKEAPRSKLDEMAMPYGYGGRTGNHQGIIAVVPPMEYAEIEDIFRLAEERKEPPFIVALDGITDQQNLGSIVRSAEEMGVHGIILPKRGSASMTAAACKVASGAEEYIPIVRVSNLVQTMEELKGRGIWIACADMDGVPAGETDMRGAMMLVVGAEGKGVSRLTKEKSDFVVRIETTGKVGSLNAAVAAAVLIYEKKRQG